MFFRLPTGVFTLYVKDYLAFSFSKIAFNFATISGCSAAKFFSNILFQVVKLFFLAIA